MPSLTGIVAVFALSAAVALGAGCGDEIGDGCSISGECSNRGTRFCDTTQPGGYCTVIGCDFGTCPDEAVCIRFFAAGPVPADAPCDHETEDISTDETEDISTDDCSFDELCTFSDYCAPRTAEERFCMKKCGGNGDCRDDYECRTRELMIAHGGEPVPELGQPLSEDPQKFCAAE